ncbi:ribosomal protein L28e [Meredithblackwellia eburnea MCA 4105]
MASGNIASADLTWLLIKKGTSFTHKRFGAYKVFSAEKGNLTNIHAHKFSGLANERTIDISAKSNGNGIVISSRKEKASPFAVASAKSSKSVRGKSGRKAAREVTKAVGGRLDLRNAAVARASAIVASQKARKEQRVRASRPKASQE